LGVAPGIAANPRVLICDTDAILQLVIGDVIPCLVELKRRYGVQPMVVDRVSHELERIAKTNLTAILTQHSLKNIWSL
jgi:hypothetical protein